MPDMETQKNAIFDAENTISPANPHKIEDWKMECYRVAWRAIKTETEADDIRSHRLPCPSLFCRRPVYACTLDEVDAIRKGEHVCEYCREHGGKSSRLELWESVCPRAFREGATATDPKKLSRLKTLATFWTEALPVSSLYISGQTGSQKSRTLFHLMERNLLPSGHSFRVLGGGEFRELMLSASADYSRVNDIKAALAETDLLIFDDFAQDSATDTMLGDLWSILDKRFRNARTTIFLSNVSPQELATRYGKNYEMLSMIRRIKDFCKILKF